MQVALAAQEYGHRVWSIVRLFYTSRTAFLEQHANYEDTVQKLALAAGVDRRSLRLTAKELAALLDFKALEDLRDGSILRLKDLCHQVYRSDDHTDPLDRYVSDIFHEISILKEEHYTVKTYAPMYERVSENVELQYILDEAHTMFPQKLSQVHYLYERASQRMAELLPSFGGTTIFIRSLYLQRAGFVAGAFPNGIRGFYDAMYPGGSFEGFYQVGLSFYHSGFFAEAFRAFREARDGREAAMECALTSDNGAAVRESLQSISASLDAKLSRLTGFADAPEGT